MFHCNMIVAGQFPGFILWKKIKNKKKKGVDTNRWEASEIPQIKNALDWIQPTFASYVCLQFVIYIFYVVFVSLTILVAALCASGELPGSNRAHMCIQQIVLKYSLGDKAKSLQGPAAQPLRWWKGRQTYKVKRDFLFAKGCWTGLLAWRKLAIQVFIRDLSFMVWRPQLSLIQKGFFASKAQKRWLQNLLIFSY